MAVKHRHAVYAHVSARRARYPTLSYSRWVKLNKKFSLIRKNTFFLKISIIEFFKSSSKILVDMYIITNENAIIAQTRIPYFMFL